MNDETETEVPIVPRRSEKPLSFTRAWVVAAGLSWVAASAAAFGLGRLSISWGGEAEKRWLLACPSYPAEVNDRVRSVSRTPSTTVAAAQAKDKIASVQASVELTFDILVEAPRFGYGLQIAAFPNRDEARTLLETHRDLLPEPFFVVESEVDGVVWYRVRVGHYRQVQKAERALSRLPEAVDGIVVRYRP